MNKHAELIKQYAEDWAQNSRPWELWESKLPNADKWNGLVKHPWWLYTMQYRHKAQFVTRTIEYPVPCTKPLGCKQIYYTPCLNSPVSFRCGYSWEANAYDLEYLKGDSST